MRLITEAQRDAVQTPHPLVMRLTELEPLKTWSLIITLFGDLDGEELTGAQIRALLGHIGIKPEAIRVALHRLKSDGWIDVAKHGREAVYSLSKMGRRETNAASGDVYNRKPKHPEGWQFVLVKDSIPPTGAIALTRELSVAPISVDAIDSETLRLNPSDSSLPIWVEDALVPGNIRDIAKALVDVLASSEIDRPKGVNAACFRLLILHHWRRLALRPGSWAHISLQPHGVLARCQSSVPAYLEKQAGLSI